MAFVKGQGKISKRGTPPYEQLRPLNPGDDWANPLLGQWVAWQKAARRSPETIRTRAPIVQKFAEEINVDPVLACPNDIISWFESHPDWAIATARSYWSTLSTWFSWLQRMGHREDNPMLLLDAPPKAVHHPRPVSTEDLVRLLGWKMHKKTRVMILLAAMAGLRAGEVARVRGEDVDLPGRLLYVKGKGGEVKTVPMHPLLIEAAAGMPAKGWWFPTRPSGRHALDKSVGPISAHSSSLTLARVMRRAGVRGTPHALRHWFGTNALRASKDLRTVQTLMRHKSVTSTQIYTEIADDRRSEVVAMLDPFEDARKRFRDSKGESDL